MKKFPVIGLRILNCFGVLAANIIVKSPDGTMDHKERNEVFLVFLSVLCAPQQFYNDK